MTASEMAASFAALHVGPQPFLLPNAWDVASALMLEDARFPAIGTTSLGITAATGLPDGAGAGLDATLVLVEALSRRLSVPLTVDLEGGYSNDPHEVATLAARLWDLRGPRIH
jgi:2-methylisocitrate lyase-like PEP mutase family enzyme